MTASDPLKFTKTELRAPVGAQVTLSFRNDSSVPHNVHLFAGSDAKAPSIAQTEIISGPGKTAMVTFTAPGQPGTYFFHCDVHPEQMKGNFIVGS